MGLSARLDEALFNIIAEMAHITLPEAILVPVDNHWAPVIRLDMRWEDYDDEHRYWGQWKPFVAKLPAENRYIVWDGADASVVKERELPSDPEDPEYLAPEYDLAPEDWWKMAQGLNKTDLEVLIPAMRRVHE
jgi:hypothetical protein